MEKKNKGKTIVIVILVLVILGLCGYIVYDKVFSKKIDEPIKVEKKEEKVELLTNDEALKIGKELYIKTRDIAYNHKNSMQVDTNICYSDENGQMVQTECDNFTYNKVTDNSFKNNFTAKGLKQYEEKAYEYGGGGFVVNNGNYYIKPYKFGVFNGPWDTDVTEIIVKSIEENRVILEAVETFDTDTINTTFTIIKENDTWKIDDYTDAGYLMWSKYLIQ